MTEKQTAKRKRVTKRKKSQPLRKSFLLDEDTLCELGAIQSAMRATSSTEALRRTICELAKLVRFASKGKQVQVVSPKNGEPAMTVDIPRYEPRS